SWRASPRSSCAASSRSDADCSAGYPCRFRRPRRRKAPGGVPEWLNGAVSKTVRGGFVPRGFESLPLRFWPAPGPFPVLLGASSCDLVGGWGGTCRAVRGILPIARRSHTTSRVGSRQTRGDPCHPREFGAPGRGRAAAWVPVAALRVERARSS